MTDISGKLSQRPSCGESP